MKTLNGIVFLETKDIRQALKIGNQTCLEFFIKKIFQQRKLASLGLLWKNLLRSILKMYKQLNKKEDLNMEHLNLQKKLFIFK